MKNFFFDHMLGLLFGLCLLLLTSACTVAAKPVTKPVPSGGSFTLFLQPLPQEVHRLSFLVDDLVALGADGSEVQLPLLNSRFSADELAGAQKKITNFSLPPGRYLGIALRVVSASLEGEEGLIDLLAPKERLVIEHPFIIRENQAETLFLTLSDERLVTDGAFFTPRFTLWRPDRLLINLKGFVSNSASQSLTVFNKRTAQVTESIRIGKGPRGLALDQQRNWLYIALAEENSVAVIEVNNGSILGRVPLRFGDEPTELALSASGRTLLCLNHGSGTVSIIDTAALFETGRIRLLSRPGRVISGSDDSQAYVTHPESMTLSVLDLQEQELRSSVPLEKSPLDGAVSADGRSLFLINDYSSEMTVLDASSLINRESIFIGGRAISIKVDNSSGLIYIGKQDGDIAVVDPRSLIAIDSYSLPGAVQDLTIDNEENALFAVLSPSDGLVKIDLISKKVLGRVELESGSHSVVVMGER